MNQPTNSQQETIATLVRDLTKVGSISKSEARRRIESLISQVISDAKRYYGMAQTDTGKAQADIELTVKYLGGHNGK